MTRYKFNKAMKILDHAIDSLGPTKPCGLLIVDGNMCSVPNSDTVADQARGILANAMIQLVQEQLRTQKV